MDEYREFAKNNREHFDPKTGAKVTIQFFIGGKYRVSFDIFSSIMATYNGNFVVIYTTDEVLFLKKF